MPEAIAHTEVQVDFEAVVSRCGCGDPDSHSKLTPPQPCPTPRAIENLGVIATNHKPTLLERIARRIPWPRS